MSVGEAMSQTTGCRHAGPITLCLCEVRSDVIFVRVPGAQFGSTGGPLSISCETHVITKHSTGTTTYFILASTPTPLNSYLSLIHSSVQILFMILLLLSSPASLHCSTPSITWRFIRERLKSDVGVALPAQLKWTIIIVTLYFTFVYSYS